MVESAALQEFFARSREFWQRHKRPISHSTTLEALVKGKQISEYDAKKYVQTNRVLVHRRAKRIAQEFLDYKHAAGSKVEKVVYGELHWNLDQFIIRLIKKRPLCFFNSSDETLLRDGRHFKTANENWDRCGTDHEMQSIRMRDYLTYDEMMISSLLAVSGYTAYLNDGNRHNEGKLDFGYAHREGIQIGLVGARFERKGRMDSVYVSSKNDTHSFVASQFLKGHTFEERYKYRMSIPIETLLTEAESRGEAIKRQTWVHVVGLGLGVWQIDDSQPRWYIEAFAHALKSLKLKRIDVLEFAWIKVDNHTEKLVEAAAALQNIRIKWSKRPPSARLEDFSSQLLVTTYAWDANSYPGNEFYIGALSASGDPAAACSSLISETQNPEINRWMNAIAYLP